MRAAVRVHSSEWQESGKRKAVGLGGISYGLGEPGGDMPGVKGDLREKGC